MRFSLRTLFLIVTGLAILFGAAMFMTRDYRERLAIRNELLAIGAQFATVQEDRSIRVLFTKPVPAEIARFKRLQVVELQGMTLDRQTFVHLGQLEEMETLLLQRCTIDDSSDLTPLLNVGTVQTLIIWNSTIDESAFDTLVQLPNLRTIDLQGVTHSTVYMKKLREVAPDVQIQARP